MLQGVYFIGDEIENPKDIYELKINLMHGDADAYSSMELFFERHEEHMLTATLDVLRQMVNHEKWTQPEKYYSLLGFEELLSENWDSDSTCDGMFSASYDGYTLTYYNGKGRQYKVIDTIAQI